MLRSIKNKLLKVKNGNIVIGQKPNWPIILWFFLMLGGAVFNRGILTSLSAMFLAIWAILELFEGVNYFRRLLGLTVLLYLVVSRVII